MIWPTPSAAVCAHNRRITFGRGTASRRSTLGRGGGSASSTQRNATISSPTVCTVAVPRGPSTTPTRTSWPGSTRSTLSRCAARAPPRTTAPPAPTSSGSSRTRFTGSYSAGAASSALIVGRSRAGGAVAVDQGALQAVDERLQAGFDDVLVDPD